jgi:hypothetical protein
MTQAQTAATVRKRPSTASRRVGYVVAVLANAAMLYAVNVWPGWDAVPFLTGETEEVLGIVNASIIVGLVANAAYVLYDRPWFRAWGDITTNAVSLSAMVAIWRVFPFDFAESAVNWPVVVHVMLALGIFGTAVAIVVALVRLVRAIADRRVW